MVTYSLYNSSSLPICNTLFICSYSVSLLMEEIYWIDKIGEFRSYVDYFSCVAMLCCSYLPPLCVFMYCICMFPGSYGVWSICFILCCNCFILVGIATPFLCQCGPVESAWISEYTDVSSPPVEEDGAGTWWVPLLECRRLDAYPCCDCRRKHSSFCALNTQSCLNGLTSKCFLRFPLAY